VPVSTILSLGLWAENGLLFSRSRGSDWLWPWVVVYIFYDRYKYMKGRNGRHKCVIGVKDTTWAQGGEEEEKSVDGGGPRWKPMATGQVDNKKVKPPLDECQLKEEKANEIKKERKEQEFTARAHNSSDQKKAHGLRAARRRFFISISSAWDLGRGLATNGRLLTGRLCRLVRHHRPQLQDKHDAPFTTGRVSTRHLVDNWFTTANTRMNGQSNFFFFGVNFCFFIEFWWPTGRLAWQHTKEGQQQTHRHEHVRNI
jgi:hypothetical protein